MFLYGSYTCGTRLHDSRLEDLTDICSAAISAHVAVISRCQCAMHAGSNACYSQANNKTKHRAFFTQTSSLINPPVFLDFAGCGGATCGGLGERIFGLKRLARYIRTVRKA